MANKSRKIVGLKKSDFESLVRKKEKFIRDAPLLSRIKTGDETALTLLILSSPISFIKEFRNRVLTAVNMMTEGQFYIYTDVSFTGFADSHVDGLLLVENHGIIEDAALLELKKGKAELEEEQIERYLDIAKGYGIPKLITVSNQYVSDPSRFPIDIKSSIAVQLYHFSWTHLLTLAHVVLSDNDLNNDDEGQTETMKEVVRYLEKKDLASILGQSLGSLVNSGEIKSSNNRPGKNEADKKVLQENKRLVSSLKVKGAVSDIKIHARFERGIVEMSADFKAPSNKKTEGQWEWIFKQLDKCRGLNSEDFTDTAKQIFLEIYLKDVSKPVKISLSALETFPPEIKDKDIKSFKILLVNDFGRQFTHRKNVVSLIETMLLDFYSNIVQHLSPFEPPSRKLSEKNEMSPMNLIAVEPKSLNTISQKIKKGVDV